MFLRQNKRRNLVNVTCGYFEVSEPNSIVPTMTSNVPIHQVLFSSSLNKMLPKSAYNIKESLIRQRTCDFIYHFKRKLSNIMPLLTVARKLDAVLITDT